MPAPKTLVDAISDKFTIGDECWDWIACRNVDGYGCIFRDGRMRLAHRVVYEWLRGPIPDGLQIDHLCRNRGCVNPWHMECVTGPENQRRGNVNQNTTKTECPRGHPYDDENTYRDPRGWRQCRRCKSGSA